MKDLSKRFINIHAGLSPLASVEASKGVLVDQSHQVQQVGGGVSSWHRVVSTGLGTLPPGCLQWFLQVDPLQQRGSATATVLPTPSPGFYILILYIIYCIIQGLSERMAKVKRFF